MIPPVVQLGRKYRDQITGFEGVATSLHTYLYGCRRVTLSGLVEGKPEDFTFDEPGLVELTTSGPIPEQDTGGPRPDPRARTAGARGVPGR